jgi:hypothetical protein
MFDNQCIDIIISSNFVLNLLLLQAKTVLFFDATLMYVRERFFALTAEGNPLHISVSGCHVTM